jgi:hypothetical protein
MSQHSIKSSGDPDPIPLADDVTWNERSLPPGPRGEFVLAPSGAGPIELVQEGSAIPTLPGRSNVEAIVTAAAKVLSPAEAREKFQAGFELSNQLEQFRSHRDSPFGKVRAEHDRMSSVAHHLGSALKITASVFSDPTGVVNAFANDLARRLAGKKQIGGLLADEVDRARITLILGSGVGLRDEDTALGGKSDESRDKMSEAPAKKPVIERLSAEDKDRRRMEKLARLKGKPLPDTSQPASAPAHDKEAEVQSEAEGSFEQELSQREASSRRARLDDCRPNQTHLPYRSVKVAPAQPQNPHLSADARRKLESELRQQSVYDVASALATWGAAAFGPGAGTPARSHPEALAQAQRAEAALRQIEKDWNALYEPLYSAMKAIARQLAVDPKVVEQLPLGQQRMLRTLTAHGMSRIIHDEPTISAAAVAAAHAERQAAEAERTAKKNNWKGDRWGAFGDPNDKPRSGLL